MNKYFLSGFFLGKSSRAVGIENAQKLDKTPPETGDTVPNVRCARKKDLEKQNPVSSSLDSDYSKPG